MKYFYLYIFFFINCTVFGQTYLLDSTITKSPIQDELEKKYYSYNLNEQLVQVKLRYSTLKYIYRPNEIEESQYLDDPEVTNQLFRREISKLNDEGQVISKERFSNIGNGEKRVGLDTFIYYVDGQYLYRSSYNIKNNEAQIGNRYQAYFNDELKKDSSTWLIYTSSGELSSSIKNYITYDGQFNPILEVELHHNAFNLRLDSTFNIFSLDNELIHSISRYYNNDTLNTIVEKNYHYLEDRIEINEINTTVGENEFMYVRHIFPSTQILTDLDSVILYGDLVSPSEILTKNTIRVDSSDNQSIRKVESSYFSYMHNGLIPSFQRQSFYHKNRVLFEYESEENKISFTPFPNPIKSDAEIIVISDKKFDSFEIYDLLGRVIFKSSIPLSKRSLIKTPLESGTYVLKIMNSNTNEYGLRQIVVIQ